MADTHDMYPNAPLALVVAEVRFPNVPDGRALPMPAQRAMRDWLGEDWVIETLKAQHLQVELDQSGAGRQRLDEEIVPRCTVRDRTLAVAMPQGRLTVETTAYQRYPEFRDVLERAFSAAAEIIQPDGVARIGLRYIDEIRVPGMSAHAPSAWEQWLDPSLLAPQVTAMEASGMSATNWDGVAQYTVGEDMNLNLRYGPQDGYAVPPNGALRRLSPPPAGPLFVLDFDCSWNPSYIPEFDVAALLETCDRLRQPVRTLFDLLITKKLRDEVFMEAMPSG